MQIAGISLAVGLTDTLDDDLDAIVSGVWSTAEFAFFVIIVLALLIIFARIDRALERRMSPVDRMIWRRAFGMRAWR